jgi:hypothetical protein
MGRGNESEERVNVEFWVDKEINLKYTLDDILLVVGYLNW